VRFSSSYTSNTGNNSNNNTSAGNSGNLRKDEEVEVDEEEK